MYYVYIIRCRPDVLYTGITTDVRRRMSEHAGQSEKGAKFTRSHEVIAIEALWTAGDRSLASKLEAALKKLTRARKNALIAGNIQLTDCFGSEFSANYVRIPVDGYADVFSAHE